MEKLYELSEIVGKIIGKSENGNFIYRGESKLYEKVTSNLYRRMEETGLLEEIKIDEAGLLEESGFKKIRDRELKEARKYIEGTDFEIFSQIQHFGGRTNLIDFTKNFDVALFFACERFHSEPGRIILQDRNGKRRNYIKEPQDVEKGTRPDIQESVFIDPPNGFFVPDPDDVVEIPAELKIPMLKYLEGNGINKSAKEIYPDLHGFIRSQEIRWESYHKYKTAIAHLNEGDDKDNVWNSAELEWYYSNAINLLTESIELVPNYAKSYNNRGFVYLQRYTRDKTIEDFENGINDFNTVIELNSDRDTVYYGYYNKGTLYLENGELGRAIDNFRKAIALNPDLDRAKNNLRSALSRRGEYCIQKGDVGNAIVDFKELTELFDPSHDEAYKAYNYLGIAYMIRGDHKNAFVNLDISVGLNPNKPEVYNNRGLAYLNKDGNDRNDIDNAIEEFKEAIEADRYYVQAYIHRGWAYFTRGRIYCIDGDLDKAFEHYKKAISIVPNHSRAHNNIGAIYDARGNYDDAIENYTKAIEFDPSDPCPYSNRSRVYARIGEHEKAEQDRMIADRLDQITYSPFSLSMRVEIPRES